MLCSDLSWRRGKEKHTGPKASLASMLPGNSLLVEIIFFLHILVDSLVYSRSCALRYSSYFIHSSSFISFPRRTHVLMPASSLRFLGFCIVVVRRKRIILVLVSPVLWALWVSCVFFPAWHRGNGCVSVLTILTYTLCRRLTIFSTLLLSSVPVSFVHTLCSFTCSIVLKCIGLEFDWNPHCATF